MPLYLIPFAIVILSGVAILGAYLINIFSVGTPACLPLIEGCVSISRAAREGEGVFLFRSLMTITATLLAIYWWLAWQWFRQLSGRFQKRPRKLFALGLLAAIFLALYANFLGSDGATYQLLRRYGITFFFAFTIMAQIFYLKYLSEFVQLRDAKDCCYYYQKRLYACCAAVLLLALVSVVSRWLSLDSDQSENVLEWNVTLIFLLFYYLSGRHWQRHHFIANASVAEPS